MIRDGFRFPLKGQGLIENSRAEFVDGTWPLSGWAQLNAFEVAGLGLKSNIKEHSNREMVKYIISLEIIIPFDT